jgi:hypothetical protein
MKFARMTVAAILLTAAGTAMCEADGNPLIGDWVMSGPGHVDRDGFNWCAAIPRLGFTATTQTLYVAATKFRPASQSVATVHYLVSGNKVYVSSAPGFYGAPSYRIVGPGKMESEDAGHCSFDRK